MGDDNRPANGEVLSETQPPQAPSLSAAEVERPPPPAPEADLPAKNTRGLTVVGIGASAGGLEAIREFFAAMPAVPDMAFVVVQHLAPDHPSHMAEILAKSTRLHVVEAADGMPLEAGWVYTIPPGKFLCVADGRLHLAASVTEKGARTPIDFLFRSLAAELQEKAVCVVLSGTGSDGTHGLRAVRGAGGMAMAQSPDTAEYDSMPRSAIATNLVDYVLPPREMPQALLAYLDPAPLEKSAEAAPQSEDEPLRVIHSIVGLLAARTKCDFRCYKKSTIRRRIERRMVLKQAASLGAYLQLLRDDADEAAALAKDMLISVTSFFREPEAFEVLQTSALGPLVQEKDSGDPLRIWIPGCATGEEVYSIAMLAQEELAKTGKASRVQVFASDIDADALRTARAGIYPECVAADIPADRLARFFRQSDHTYQVDKPLRETVVFTQQNVLSDPPFSRVDLVSCRNLLIYLEPDAQRKVMAVFAFALRTGGYLFLGKSDGIGDATALFEPVSRSFRLYRRTAAPALPFAGLPRLSSGPVARPPATRGEDLDPAHLAELNQRVLLKLFAAAVILTDLEGKILHFFGPTEKYLVHPTGQATFDLFSMVQPEIAPRLRSAVYTAAHQKEIVRLESVRFGEPPHAITARVAVMPAGTRTGGGELLAVAFEEMSPPSDLSPAGKDSADPDSHPAALSQLEAELRLTKEDHRAVVEELETANEELRLTNEEVMSVNEEMQSANEELEASKEELQSINEELNTVNAELAEKIEELTRANDDLANLFSASDLATIFVDLELRIKSFSPPAAKLVNLLPADVGRPIGHIAHKLVDVEIVAEVTHVLQSLGMVEKEVQARDGAWYTMRVLPYRTGDNRIAGAVLSFGDVTRLKRAEQDVDKARNFAESIVKTVRDPLIVLDASLRIVSANPAFYREFQATPAEAEGQLLYEFQGRQWDTADLRRLLAEVIPGNRQFKDFEVAAEFQGAGRRVLLLNARRIDSPGEETPLILLAIEDVTEARRIARELEQAKLQAEDANRAKGYFLANTSHELRTPMSGILGMLELAMVEDLPPLVREYLQTAKGSADVLLTLLNDILDLSRIEAGKLSLEAAPFHLRALLDETLKPLAFRAHEKGLELTSDIPETVPDFVCGDSVRLRQVLVNLIGNGIKFTAQGQISLGVKALARTDATVELQFLVADTGIGIPRDAQPRVFERFVQADAGAARKYGGAGLGLTISKSLVDMMGGSIRVQSEPGQGSTFVFTVPLSLCPDNQPAAPALGRLLERVRGLPVLVVDDNATNRRVLAAMLGSWSMHTVAAGDARTALTTLQEAAEAGSPFALAIVDMMMPDEDGLTLAQRIHDDPRLAGTVLLMLSSAGHPAETERRKAPGIAAYLEKPVSQLDLLRAIGRVMGVSVGAEPAAKAPLTPGSLERPQRSLRVLVAEDTPANQKLMVQLLGKRGHTVDVADNGAKAVEMVRQGDYDLILMDVLMPLMDGLEATAHIRAMPDPKKARLPIIALTAGAMKGDQERCLEAGMDGYIAKPIDSRELLRLVERAPPDPDPALTQVHDDHRGV